MSARNPVRHFKDPLQKFLMRQRCGDEDWGLKEMAVLWYHLKKVNERKESISVYGVVVNRYENESENSSCLVDVCCRLRDCSE